MFEKIKKLNKKKVAKHLNRRLYNLTGGKLGRVQPSTVAISLIAQCNYRCRFCEIVGTDALIKSQGKHYHSNILTLEQVMRYERFLKTASVYDFGGLTALGEALLSPHFRPIIEYLRRLNPDALVNLTTNGSLLDEKMAKFLIENAPLKATFSLHALSPDIYRATMGPSPEATIANIERFCRLAQGHGKVRTALNFGIGRHNHQDAIKLVEFAHKNRVGYINVYPYYKSPNNFSEDVSLYGEPDLANKVLDEVYARAAALGVKVIPATPGYLGDRTKQTTAPHLASTPEGAPSGSREERKNAVKTKSLLGNCPRPYNNFILKSDPLHKDRIGLCVCNRFIPFLIDYTKEITDEDLDWVWNHPLLKDLRLHNDDFAICQFCQDGATQELRSLDYDEYRQRRDQAIRTDLRTYQDDRRSPSGSIELLDDNIFSIN